MSRLFVVSLTCLVMAGSARADLIVLSAVLSGANETPPNTSPATGLSRLTLDTVANTIAWNVTFGGFLGTPTIAHFHVGNVGVAGPVLYDIAPTNPYSSPLVGSAALVNKSVSVGGVPTTFSVADQKQQLLDGLWYTNLHSSRFPGGEARGQLSVVPVPPAAVLAAVGALTLFGRRRLVG